VCPCHYSTFDVLRSADPIFGPAVRPLAQLPLAIAGDRALVAAGPLSGPVGPSYWGVRHS
jgi:ubiquinol-cytochrome c reductase iron-sulfur subunit